MKYIKQFAIILSISLIAELMEYLIPIPVAASIYGLVLMLIGLITKLIPLEKVEGAADFLVEIMPIMFIPATVGIMASADALKEMLIPLCVICVVTTILIMAVTGKVSQSIIRRSAGGTCSAGGTYSAVSTRNACSIGNISNTNGAQNAEPEGGASE